MRGQRQERTWAGRPVRGSRAARRDGRSRAAVRDRFLVIFLVYVLLSAGMATATAGVLHRKSVAPIAADGHATKQEPAKYLVLFVLDGARPDYIGLTHLPHVDALRAHGTQYTNAMDGILESETPSGHTAIATGSTPAHDGILGFNWAQNDDNYSLFSPTVVESGAMERIMEASKTPTIAGLYKMRYPKARVVALSGHKYYAADPLGGPDADAIMFFHGDQQGRYVPVAQPGHVPPAGVLTAKDVISNTTHMSTGGEDWLTTNLALAAFAKMKPRILLINYPEFDWPIGHVDGGNIDPTDVNKLMTTFDNDLGRIEDAYRRAGVLDQTLFVITADHGMGPIKRFVPETIFTDAVSKAGTTAPTIAYSTGTYIWLKDVSKAQAVADNIMAAHDPGVQSAYYLVPGTAGSPPHYERAGGSFVSPDVDAANKYLLATLLNGHQPSVVALCRSGASSADPSTHWKADHGGASWSSQHIPLILAGPGIRQNFVSAEPAQLDDIAPTVLTAMGVRPTGMEGRVLTEALTQPRQGDQKARVAEVRQIWPLVNALVAQSNYEDAG